MGAILVGATRGSVHPGLENPPSEAISHAFETPTLPKTGKIKNS